MPPMYSASMSYSMLRPKRVQDNQLSGPQPGKSILHPQYGYGPTAALLTDDLTLSQLQKQDSTDIEPDTFCPGPDNPTDPLGRFFEEGGVVETLRTLYRNQGDDVKVSSGWCGVIVKIDDEGDVLVAFGEGLAKKWIRRKHLGTLKKLEENDLEQRCTSGESNTFFHSPEHNSESRFKSWIP